MTIRPSAPRLDAPQPDRKKWTILLYSASDNNLQSYQIGNINDIETVGSDQDTNVVAQVDTGDQCNRYLLGKTTTPTAGTIASPSVQKMGPVDMADPQTLADFIVWGQKNYPAEHTMVIVADHGNGWQGAVEDDSAGTWMSLPKIRAGFDKAQAVTGQKVDVIGFDACLMASAEVADELKDSANFLVVSQETEGVAGWPYSHVLTPTTLKNLHQMNATRINVTPKDLATQVVKDAAGTQDVLPTMTAVDTSAVPALVSSLDVLGKAIVATGTPAAALSDVVNNTQSFTDYRDAYDFASRLQQNGQTDASVKTAAQGVMDSLGHAVIAEQHSTTYPGAHGLTLEISTNGPRDGYADLQFAHDTQWSAALQKLQAVAPPPTPDPPSNGSPLRQA